MEHRDALDRFGRIDPFQLRPRHLAEVAEAPDDRLEIGDLHAKRMCTLAKDFIEFLFRQLPRAHQVLDCQLQGKKRVLKFMSKASSQLSPGCDALALDEPFALRAQLCGHVIETARQPDYFVTAALAAAQIDV